jgi:hypothetical protein
LGHKLLALWDCCLTFGLDPDPEERDKLTLIFEMLAPFIGNHEFRYLRPGFKRLPCLDHVTLSACELLGAVKRHPLYDLEESVGVANVRAECDLLIKEGREKFAPNVLHRLRQ